MIRLQLESRHNEFFGVLCLHSYYTDFVCRDLEFEPTPETAQLLRNYGLIFKPMPFGFLVVYSPQDSEERLLEMPPKTRFSFRIRNHNARFMNFSQLPFWPEGVSFHYSNIGHQEADFDYEIPKDVFYYFKGLKVADVKKKLLHLPEHTLLSLRPKKFLLNLVDGESAILISQYEMSSAMITLARMFPI